MPAIWTDGGLAAFANSHLTGAPVDITELRIGQQGVGYDPSPTQTGLRNDATPVVFPVSEMNLTSSGPRVSYDLMLERAGVLTAQEVGFFAGATMVAIWSEVGRPVFVKDAAATAVLAFIYEYQQGVPTSLDIAVTAFQFVFATPTEAAAAIGDASTDKVMSPRRVWDWWGALSGTFIATKLAAVNNIFDLAFGDNSIYRRHLRDRIVNGQKIAEGGLQTDNFSDDVVPGTALAYDAEFREKAQDSIGAAISTGTLKGISVVYDDTGEGSGKLNFTTDTVVFFGTTEEPSATIRRQMKNNDIYLQYKA